MNEKTHLDLFSGIGGFALAARWNGYRTVGFCDNEPYAQAVLKKHWPDVPCHKDIREVRGELYAGVTLLTGGFPCQPFSVAGKQGGKDDDRYLWPEMLRVIREARPTWIIGENVAGIVNMELDKVHTDLEAEGYEVESIIIPACGVDAQHRRNRVWIIGRNKNNNVANSEGLRLGGWREQGNQYGGGVVQAESKGRKVGSQIEGCCSFCGEVMANAEQSGRQGWVQGGANEERKDFQGHARCCCTARGESGEAVWPIEPRVGRLAHGVSDRVAKLKGLGNAIVPQVASEIIRCINQVMEDNK